VPTLRALQRSEHESSASVTQPDNTGWARAENYGGANQGCAGWSDDSILQPAKIKDPEAIEKISRARAGRDRRYGIWP